MDNQNGYKVYTVESLSQLSRFGKCVMVPKAWGSKHIPAAFIMSMQARCVLNLIAKGVYVYKAKGGK